MSQGLCDPPTLLPSSTFFCSFSRHLCLVSTWVHRVLFVLNFILDESTLFSAEYLRLPLPTGAGIFLFPWEMVDVHWWAGGQSQSKRVIAPAWTFRCLAVTLASSGIPSSMMWRNTVTLCLGFGELVWSFNEVNNQAILSSYYNHQE